MTQNLSIVGIDLAKSVFHLVGMDERTIVSERGLPTACVRSSMTRGPRARRSSRSDQRVMTGGRRRRSSSVRRPR